MVCSQFQPNNIIARTAHSYTVLFEEHTKYIKGPQQTKSQITLQYSFRRFIYSTFDCNNNFRNLILNHSLHNILLLLRA
jgi:hypothetical protein